MLRFMTAGESHGPCLTIVVDGLPAGMVVDVEAINHELARRQGGYGRNFRQKIEHDQIDIIGGVLYGKTIGAPVAMRIANKDWENWREKWQSGELPKLVTPRPGHADYSGMVKYGLDDGRLVLERSSARETASRVAAGALAKQMLAAYGMQVGSFVLEVGRVAANIPNLPLPQLWEMAEACDMRTPDEAAAIEMRALVDEARRTLDTLGGIFEVQAIGAPIGLGTYAQWDRRLDARIAAAMFSIQAIKGVEIGPAFENARMNGTVVHDDMFPDGKGGVLRHANRAGGLEGGMTNGEPVVVRAAMKPISTTGKPHKSVNLATGEPAEPIYQRSDWCAVPAAAVVGEAMLAWALAEAVVEKFGGDQLP